MKVTVKEIDCQLDTNHWNPCQYVPIAKLELSMGNYQLEDFFQTKVSNEVHTIAIGDIQTRRKNPLL